jgi:hypothetical protein
MRQPGPDIRRQPKSHYRPPAADPVRACAAPHPNLLPGGNGRQGEGINPCPACKERQGEGHECASLVQTFAGSSSLITTRRRLRQSVLAPPLILTFSPAAMAAKAKGQDWY